jgi:hypothetical protein
MRTPCTRVQAGRQAPRRQTDHRKRERQREREREREREAPRAATHHPLRSLVLRAHVWAPVVDIQPLAHQARHDRTIHGGEVCLIPARPRGEGRKSEGPARLQAQGTGL